MSKRARRECYCGHAREKHTMDGAGACACFSVAGWGMCACDRYRPAPRPKVRPEERGRYRIVHVCIDVQKGGEDEYREMRSRLDAMEAELRGFHVLGTDETQGWPTVRVSDRTPAAPQGAEGEG